MTTYMINNLTEAEAVLNYFNGFHDGFIKQLALISHDRFEARGVQTRGEGLTLEITLAHYNYQHDSKPVDQLIKAAAHVYGGYAGVVPEGLSNEAFAVFDRAVKEQGAAGVVPSALDEIAGVALRGLVPLAKSAESPAQRAKPEPMAPAGSGCPFGGKLNPDLFDG